MEVILAGGLIGVLAQNTITMVTAATLSAVSAAFGTVLAALLSMIVLRQLHLPVLVDLERSQWEALRLYATDDPRRLYQVDPGGSWDALIRLRDDSVRWDQLRAVILRRVWWERFGYFLLLGVTVIGTTAAVVAAVEGWKD